MRNYTDWIVTAALVLSGGSVNGQQLPGAASPQIRKEWALGQQVSVDLERRDGRIDDAAVTGYLSQIENRLLAGKAAMDIRVTRSARTYAHLLLNRVLYISAGLLDEIRSESELAGLIAHELAHAEEPAIAWQPGAPAIYGPKCVASGVPRGRAETLRQNEQRATASATSFLKVAGYDPASVMDVLSRLSYEHPDWSRAIVPDDLLVIRVAIEDEIPPAGGYVVDDSRFRQMQTALAAITGHTSKISRRINPPTLQRQ
jgi:hypothetical protein